MKVLDVDAPTSGILLLQLDEGKANAIGPAFAAAFRDALDEIQARRPRALIVTGAGKHFSAGLHLADLSALDRDDMDRFVLGFEQGFLDLFLLPFPVVAAVNGSAVAGGAVLAACCDYRVAVDSGARIGINEVTVGVSLPSIAAEAMRCLLSAAALRQVALGGRLYEPEQAVALGLVDERVAGDRLIARATEVAGSLATSPAGAFAQIKRELRAPYADRVRTAGAMSRRAFVDLWFTEEAQALRARFL